MNGIKTYGKVSAGSAIQSIGNAVDEGTGTNAGSSISGFVYTYVMGLSPMPAQLAEINSLCHSILDEIDETQDLIKETAAQTQAMIGKQNVDAAAANMESQWQTDVTDIIDKSRADMSSGLSNAFSKYKDYLKAADAYRQGSGSEAAAQAAEEEFQKAVVIAKYGAYSDLYQNAALSSGDVNRAMLGVCSELVSRLAPSGNQENYVDKAGKYAFNVFAFSNEQHRYITAKMDEQIEEITLAMMMYEEYLGWQSRYLAEKHPKLMTDLFPGFLTAFETVDEDFANALYTLLFEREINMSDSKGVRLRYGQFFTDYEAGYQRDGIELELVNYTNTKAPLDGTDYIMFQTSHKGSDSLDTWSHGHSKPNTINGRVMTQKTISYDYRLAVTRNGGTDKYLLHAYSDIPLPFSDFYYKSSSDHNEYMSCDLYNNIIDREYAEHTYKLPVEESDVKSLFDTNVYTAYANSNPAEYLKSYCNPDNLYLLYRYPDSYGSDYYKQAYLFHAARLDSTNTAMTFPEEDFFFEDIKNDNSHYAVAIAKDVTSDDTQDYYYVDAADQPVYINGQIWSGKTRLVPNDTVEVGVDVPEGKRIGRIYWRKELWYGENYSSTRNGTSHAYWRQILYDAQEAGDMVVEDGRCNFLLTVPSMESAYLCVEFADASAGESMVAPTANLANPEVAEGMEQAAVQETDTDTPPEHYRFNRNKRTAVFTGTDDAAAKRLIIPATVTEGDVEYTVVGIAPKAFAGMAELEEVVVGENVRFIGAYAFKDCVNLRKVKIGENVRTIGAHAFHGADSLTELAIRSKLLEKAKVKAFLANSSIEMLRVPKAKRALYEEMLTKSHTKAKRKLILKLLKKANAEREAEDEDED